jgi:hypothetical protein
LWAEYNHKEASVENIRIAMWVLGSPWPYVAVLKVKFRKFFLPGKDGKVTF